ncbi:MAG: methyltransferase domain-containing protein [Bradymonadales bacterium]|nr:methyltransferase domain-containing protein [Bradymonadales bacterium]
MAGRYDHLRSYYKGSQRQRDSARHVRWLTYDGQILRLQVLLEALSSADYPVSVLDVGCGLGALYGYLRDTDRLGPYLGIDLLPEMVDQARREFPEARFEMVDLLDLEATERFDLVVCSGSLNVMVKEHERWIKEMLAAMWKHATLAVAVNIQTTRAFRYNPASRGDNDLCHVDPASFLSWCEQLTPWVSMRQDYLGSEAAFYLYREYHRSARPLQRDHRHDRRAEWEQACGMAYLLLERKLPMQALAVLETAGDQADVFNYRGMCYHRLGQLEQARQWYLAALELDPDHPEASLNVKYVL